MERLHARPNSLEHPLIAIWNSSDDVTFVLSGSGGQQVHERTPPDVRMTLPPKKFAALTTLPPMIGEEGDYVTWLRSETAGAPENLFLVILEGSGDVNLVPCTPSADCNVLLLPAEHARLVGLSPFRRVATFVLVSGGAPAPVSPHLGARARMWMSSGEAWSTMAQPASDDESD